MGGANTKPMNVSDAAWERVQNRKLDMIAEAEKKKADDMAHLASSFSDYCSACNDVPKLLMFFPSYRERCSQARGKLFKDISGVIAHSSSDLQN